MLFDFNDFFYFFSIRFIMRFIGYSLILFSVIQGIKWSYQSYKKHSKEQAKQKKYEKQNKERLVTEKADYLRLANQMKRADYCDDADIAELEDTFADLQNSFAVKQAYDFWYKNLQRKYRFK